MNRNLLKRKALRIAMLILLLNAIGITNGNAYDFSAVCSSGQTLYYNITDATNHLVKVVFPGSSSLDPWKGYTKPTGDLLIPESVTYNNESYSVTSISYNSFYGCTGIISVTIGESVTSIDGGAFVNFPFLGQPKTRLQI